MVFNFLQQLEALGLDIPTVMNQLAGKSEPAKTKTEKSS
jgi:hypothetical protein